MGGARAERRGQHAAQHDTEERRQVDETETAGGQAAGAPAAQHVADRAGDGDRKPDRRGGGDRPVQRDVVPQHERHRQGAAADADPARHRADRSARQRRPGLSRQAAMRRRPEIQPHLDGGVEQEGDEEQLQQRRRHLRRQHRAGQRAEHDARRDAPHQRPNDRAVAMVGAHAGQRGEQDRGKRSAERQLRLHAGSQSLRVQQENQHRHDDEAAADAEQAGDEADHQPQSAVSGEQRRIEHHRCLTMKAYSAGSTGVIDRRLPFCRMRMLASAG